MKIDLECVDEILPEKKAGKNGSTGCDPRAKLFWPAPFPTSLTSEQAGGLY